MSRELVETTAWLVREVLRLRAALQALVDNVLDYEKVNNLSPNPGRKYCWDTVAHAVEVLNQQSGRKE